MANTSSSKTLYWVVGAVLLLAVVGFGGYKVWHHYEVKGMMQQPTAMTANNAQATPAAMQDSSSGGLQNKDTSNQQLDSDMQDVQNSMNQLQQDQNTSNKDVSNQSLDVPQQ